jgi:hypothetical protein
LAKAVESPSFSGMGYAKPDWRIRGAKAFHGTGYQFEKGRANMRKSGTRPSKISLILKLVFSILLLFLVALLSPFVYAYTSLIFNRDLRVGVVVLTIWIWGGLYLVTFYHAKIIMSLFSGAYVKQKKDTEKKLHNQVALSESGGSTISPLCALEEE